MADDLPPDEKLPKAVRDAGFLVLSGLMFNALIVFIGVLCLVAAVAKGAEPYEAQGVRVVDGDTVHVDVLHLPWGLALTDVTVRAADYDAWESTRHRFGSKTTEEELRKGRAAKAELQGFVANRPLHVVPLIFGSKEMRGNAGKRDSFGRLLGVFMVRVDHPKGERSWLHIGPAMQDRGHDRRPRNTLPSPPEP